MLDYLLVLVLDLIEELADGLKLLPGCVDHAGNLRLNGYRSLGGFGDFKEAVAGLGHDADALPQGLLGRFDAAAEPARVEFHIVDPSVHLAGQHLDLPGQLLHLSGHHREAPALCAGPGSLDGGVDGQDVGLVRDGDDLVHTVLNPLDGGLQHGEGPGHFLVGGLHLHRGLAQLLHLPLGFRHRLGNLRAHLGELLRRLVDVGEGVPQLQQL